MVNISSPFEYPLGTPTQSPSTGGGMGAVPGPGPDYPIVQAINLGTSGASFDSPYNEAVVQSTNTVTSADPGGSAPIDSPFKDALAK